MIKVFQTRSGKAYAYDSLTNRIITLHFSKGILLNDETVPWIHSCLVNSGMIEDSDFDSVIWELPFSEYFAKIQNQMPGLLLELTKKCNLYCDYCFVSGAFSHNDINEGDMAEETMFDAIDFFREHNVYSDSAHIGFYGGESFLKFEMIRAGVRYASGIIKDKPVSFDISTNGLALTEDVALWLAANPAVQITCTVNGPYHDKYRKNPAGAGSLNTIMDNLNRIHRKYPYVWENQVRFIANIENVQEIPALLDFYHNEIGRNPGIVTEISWGNCPPSENSTRNKEAVSVPEVDFNKDNHLSDYYAEQLWNIQHRPIALNSRQAIVTSCFPCEIKLFVHTDGTLSFCEKAPEKAIIGNLKDGLDKAAILNIYDEAHLLYQNKCRGCWAQRLCNNCICNLFDESGNFLESMPESICRKEKENVLRELILYCQMVEEAPGLLETM